MEIRQRIASWVAGWKFCVVEREYLNDLEHRFGCILDHVTGGRMSKVNYTLETMYSEIDQHVEDMIGAAIIDERDSDHILSEHTMQ